MSGGSYNYLYSREAESLHADDPDLLHAIERLSEIDYAADVAAAVTTLAATLAENRNAVQAQMDTLSGVLRALEWWDSCDTDEDGFQRALVKYREAGQR